MTGLRYELADSAAGAVAAAGSSPGARYIGGGTNLVDLMKLGVETADVLVDVNCDELRTSRVGPDGSYRVGAAVRNSDLAADLFVRRRHPAVSEALLSGASGQLRNMATLGGNLLQRTRCRYFQDVSKPCNKRIPGSGCPAVEGEHHNLAILGAGTSCIATHPSDLAVALTAAEAVIHVEGPAGDRRVAIDDFYRLPGDRPDVDTVLEPGELITAVTLPPPGGDGRAGHQTYRKVRERASFAFAVASTAVHLDVVDGDVRSCRIALGAVAHRPWRARAAEDALTGRPARPDEFARAITTELGRARPLPRNRYKLALVHNLVVATLSDLAGRPSAPPTGSETQP